MGILDSIFGGGSQEVTQKVKYPSWYTDAAKDNIQFGTNAGSWYAKPYMDNTVAGLTPLQQQMIGNLQNNVGSTNAGFSAAQGGMTNAMNYNPQMVSSQSFLQGNVGAYMDPYVQNVENQAMGRLNDQRLQSLNQTADAATRAGAFGGSRHGVVEGVTNAESAKAAGDLSANLRSQAYNNATGLMQQDYARNLQAQMANQQAGLSGANLNMQASQGLGALTAAGQDAYLQGVQGAMQGGNMQQQYNQQLLNQSADQYNAMRQYPVDIYNMRLAALSGTNIPYSQSSSGGGGLASGLMGGLGGALTGASLFGTGGALAGLGGIGAGTGAGIGGLLGLLGGLSDEDEKTNIEKLGEDEETGLSIYAYDYKADVKAAKKGKRPMPMKRVGPMAQEIEEKFPGSTRRVGGKLVVSNLGFGG